MHTLPSLNRHGTVSPASNPDAGSSPLTSALLDSTLLNYTFPTALIERLQTEHRWAPALTLRALEEYRRFLVLAATGGIPVTPSRLVDEVWHLHLTFTRDYWERLTPLMPAPLHHEPASGQPGDAAHYANQYLNTLDLYAETFGTQPPADLWPDPRRKSAPTRPLPARWLMPLVAAVIAWATFAWSSFAVIIALGVLVTVGVGVAGLALAGNGSPTPRKDRNNDSGSGGESFGGSVSGDSCDSGGGDSGCSDGGSSCGSGCGSGCGS
ncbi:glycine-rich domain-containing protein [Deinococcus oregonensis]|uniref:Glycine-rich domain-containing protein n=1 Tax=Deinococcus oregonensis TaxID=1805970 RepID=A0ABV6B627_9DEIO